MKAPKRPRVEKNRIAICWELIPRWFVGSFITGACMSGDGVGGQGDAVADIFLTASAIYLVALILALKYGLSKNAYYFFSAMIMLTPIIFTIAWDLFVG